MKIDTKPLQIGVDSIDVAGTWSQVDKADELMIASYEISDKQNDMLKALKAEREFLKNAMDFLRIFSSLSLSRSNISTSKYPVTR